MGRLRKLAVDVSPLRTSRDFRLLWVGQGISFFGSQVATVALPFQVFKLTNSSFAVGLIGAVELVPMLATSLIGGALADAHDRRRLLMIADTIALAVSASLAVNASLAKPNLVVVYALAAVAGAVLGLGRPAQWAIVPRLVDAEHVTAAGALQAMLGSTSMLLGPAVAGTLIAAFGLPATFGIDVATFVVSLVCLAFMRPVPPAVDAERVTVRGVLDGIRFLRGKPVLQGTYLVDYIAMVFGMPRALFPAFVLHELHAGPKLLGLFYAAPAAGSLVAAALSGPLRHIRRQGWAITLAVCTWGAGIVGAGLSRSVPMALACLALAGGADMVSGVFRMTVWAQVIPDTMRGRLAGIGWFNVASGPMLGDLEAGVVAGLLGVRVSIVSGGAACIAGALLLGVLMKGFVSYRRPEPAGEP